MELVQGAQEREREKIKEGSSYMGLVPREKPTAAGYMESILMLLLLLLPAPRSGSFVTHPAAATRHSFYVRLLLLDVPDVGNDIVGEAIYRTTTILIPQLERLLGGRGMGLDDPGLGGGGAKMAEMERRYLLIQSFLHLKCSLLGRRR